MAEQENNGKNKILRLTREKSRIRKKTPKFRRSESWRYKRVKSRWRRPRGIDSKMKERRKGWPKSVNVGYRIPKILRGKHPSGMEEIFVHSPTDLQLLEPESQAARIRGTVGRKKREEIMERAEILGVRILNPTYEELELGELEEELEEDLEALELADLMEEEE